MTELGPLEIIKDYSSELKKEFGDFNKEYHAEILKVWTEIVRIQEKLITMKEEQTKLSKMWGLIGGAIPASITIGVAALLYFLSHHKPPIP